VPETVARFAGAWAGAWKTPTGGDALCHTLVVEEVLSNGLARVIYSHGTDEDRNIFSPQFWRATGRIARPSTSTCATDGTRCRSTARPVTRSATDSLRG
jgi:hypothetical protein